MKKCSLCKIEKNLESFRFRLRNGKYSPRSQCKDCESKDQVKRARRRYQEDLEFREKSLSGVAKWGKENKEKRLNADAKRKRSKYKNDLQYRADVMNQSASYRSRKIKAQPDWLSEEDLNKIGNIYEVCAKVSVTTGKPHDVDHVVPLKGENICGLHVPWNLAIVPASLNRSKGNAFPCDFPIS